MFTKSIVMAIAAIGAKAASHHHHEQAQTVSLQARDGGSCSFPENEGLVPVTPNDSNAGFAMSPDQTCSSGSWCPYACPAGMVSVQWDPSVTSYTYPGSMHGGLFCQNGDLQKPFPDRPYCVNGTGSVSVKNDINQDVAFCQTVLPGNEAMLIPTTVKGSSSEVIAVPNASYWASTAAHYYINPPGVSADDGCVWGTDSEAVGNWAPYVAGANADDSGKTYVKIGWNPIYLSSKFANEKPNFGVKVTCDDGDCNGTPCGIDPSQGSVNSVQSSDGADGAGDGAFCVVTVNAGKKAQIEVFSVDTGSDLNPNAKRDLEAAGSAAPTFPVSTVPNLYNAPRTALYAKAAEPQTTESSSSDNAAATISSIQAWSTQTVSVAGARPTVLAAAANGTNATTAGNGSTGTNGTAGNATATFSPSQVNGASLTGVSVSVAAIAALALVL